MAKELLTLNPQDIIRLNKAVPRYTSYPTAPNFTPISSKLYINYLQQLTGPLSIYIHIPFCRKMCLFCGCSVVINRSEERQARYVEQLLQEIELVASKIGKKLTISQLHFGGGTPTNLTEKEFQAIT